MQINFLGKALSSCVCVPGFSEKRWKSIQDLLYIPSLHTQSISYACGGPTNVLGICQMSYEGYERIEVLSVRLVFSLVLAHGI
jgi:hypothetical protein